MWARLNEARLMPLLSSGIGVKHLFRPTLAWRIYRKCFPKGASERCLARQLIGRRENTALVLVSQGNDHSALPWLEAFQELGVPTCVVTHGVIPSDWPSDHLSKRLRKVFEAVDASFWVSKRNQKDFECQIGCRLSSAETVWNPVKVLGSTTVPWPASHDLWRMACVARLQVRPKGHDLLLQALALPHWAKRNLHLSIFGTGENRQGLEDLARLLGISARVSFPGHVETVQDIWREHHLIAQPSRNEGMPLSLVEALMCGRPALVTDVAGHTELVTEGENGFVAEAPTVKHLDEALDRAWSQRHLWQSMGASAAERIRKELPSDPVGAFADRLLTLSGMVH
jgi:glycosyltransferase involved in cell wall biosynthesis